MKNVHVKTIGTILLLMVLNSFGAWGAGMPRYDPHRDGALAELAIVVVDDEGRPVDDASLLKRCYRANPDATYQRRLEFVYDRRNGEVERCERMPKDQYMVFRTRTRTNEVGNVTSANYGLIFEKGKYGLNWNIRVGFNPTPNDTNLECTEEPHGRRR